jgi:hypothetical protein
MSLISIVVLVEVKVYEKQYVQVNRIIFFEKKTLIIEFLCISDLNSVKYIFIYNNFDT